MPLRAWCLVTLLASCGGSASTPDGAPIDAPIALDAPRPDAPAPSDAGTQLQLSKWPRQSETFQALASGADVPIVHGFQGFNYVELQIRMPATITAPLVTFDLNYDVTGLGGMMQSSGIQFGAADGGVRDSERYLIFFNVFQLQDLDGRACHITADLPDNPQVGTWDETVTLRYTGCLDNGVDVVCPDGGVP